MERFRDLSILRQAMIASRTVFLSLRMKSLTHLRWLCFREVLTYESKSDETSQHRACRRFLFRESSRRRHGTLVRRTTARVFAVPSTRKSFSSPSFNSNLFWNNSLYRFCMANSFTHPRDVGRG